MSDNLALTERPPATELGLSSPHTFFRTPGMLGWLARRREALRAHEQLWRPERETDSEGLTWFQRRAEAALASAGFPLRERAVQHLSGGDPADLFITGLAGRQNARVYLYQDGIEVRVREDVLRFEDWDSDTPDQLIHVLTDALVQFDVEAG